MLQNLFIIKFEWHTGNAPKVISGIDTSERLFYYVQRGNEKLKVFHDRVETYKIDGHTTKLLSTVTKERVDILYAIFNNPENFKR